jgi:hypothetical protein
MLRPRCKARQAPPLVDMCAPNFMRLEPACQSGFRQCRADAEAVEYYNLIDPFTPSGKPNGCASLEIKFARDFQDC